MSEPPPPPTYPPPDQPPPGYWPPVPYPYGSPPYAAGPPPPGYGPPAGYGPVVPAYGGGWYGPPGTVRPTGTTIVLFICTLGIYYFVYNYQVHTEMKRHSGRGIGGGIALLLTFVASVAMPFVTAAEVGSLYSLRGQRPPVNGWTGLWYLVPVIAGYLLSVFGTFAGIVWAVSANGSGSDLAIFGGLAIYLACMIAGGVVWFIKTNGALNRYWESIYS